MLSNHAIDPVDPRVEPANRELSLKVKMSAWQQWVQRPESLWLRKCIFYIHLWVGAGVGLYIVLMSVTGSLIVYRNELERIPSLVPIVEVDSEPSRELIVRGRWSFRKRNWRNLRDLAKSDWGCYMVARNQQLASRPDRQLEVGFCPVQLGPAQRTRILGLSLCSDVGSIGILFFLS